MNTSKFCLNARSFAAWLGCILFAEVVGSGYFRSVISTIEKRFNLPSTITAVLSSSFQIGSMTVMILVSYFGSRYHRPRTIAAGCVLISLGFLLCSVPQFAGGRYEFIDISSNDSSGAANNHSNTCARTTNDIGFETNCANNESKTTTSNMYIFILIGMMLCGIGGSPLQPLGISYIDDHATKHDAAIYIGIVTSIGLAGPAISFLLGGLTLKMWVDVGWVDTSTISISPTHPGWVGAWWLGFLISGILVLLVSLPMWFYPKQIRNSIEEKRQDKDEKSGFEENLKVTSKDFLKQSGGILKAFKRLLLNKKYLLVIALWTSESIKISGLSIFITKYLEVQFGKSASQSSFLIGAVNLPFLILGTIVGSTIIKVKKLEIDGVAKLCLISAVGALLTFAAVMFIGCDTISIAGLTKPIYGSNHISEGVVNSCNKNCNCEENIFTPVCASDGTTYVSPCLAGCSQFLTDKSGTITNYTYCNCVGGSSNKYGNQTVTVGRCTKSNCENDIWIAIAFKSAGNFLGGLHITPMMILLMRSLKPEDKSFGIGMGYFLIRLLAFIPGPVIFGSLIDSTCLYWNKRPCSNRAYCSIYDNASFRYKFLGVIEGVQVISLVIALVYYFKFAKPEGKILAQEKESIKNNKEESQALANMKESNV